MSKFMKPTRKVLTLNKPEEVIVTKTPQGVLSARAEVAMMGTVIQIHHESDLIYILDYISKTLDSTIKQSFNAKEVVNNAFKYCKNPVVHHLCVNTIEDMLVITLTMTTDEDDEEYNLLSSQGVFSYVYNVTCPDFSELGYTFFAKKESGRVRRVG